MLEGVLWVEKYRPTELKELALAPDVRKVLTGFLAKGEIPHLLLEGPAGCGKTTIAKILVAKLNCQVLTLNASSERGIDTIRDRVRNFARGLLGAEWNVVFMDEADALTPDAQTALRNTMEAYSDYSRFILTCNYLYRIIDPIQSRCMVLHLGAMPLKERYAALVRVLQAEGVQHTEEVAIGYAEKYTDMRKLLYMAQRSALAHGELRPPLIQQVDGAKLRDYIKGNEWGKLKTVARDGGTDHYELLRELFWAVPDGHSKATDLRITIARAITDGGRAPDPVVHFLGTCCELIKEWT